MGEYGWPANVIQHEVDVGNNLVTMYIQRVTEVAAYILEKDYAASAGTFSIGRSQAVGNSGKRMRVDGTQ